MKEFSGRCMEPSDSRFLSPFILPTTLSGRFCCPHFTGAGMDIRGNVLMISLRERPVFTMPASVCSWLGPPSPAFRDIVDQVGP